jgi:hypothetical protein
MFFDDWIDSLEILQVCRDCRSERLRSVRYLGTFLEDPLTVPTR